MHRRSQANIPSSTRYRLTSGAPPSRPPRRRDLDAPLAPGVQRIPEVILLIVFLAPYPESLSMRNYVLELEYHYVNGILVWLNIFLIWNSLAGIAESPRWRGLPRARAGGDCRGPALAGIAESPRWRGLPRARVDGDCREPALAGIAESPRWRGLPRARAGGDCRGPALTGIAESPRWRGLPRARAGGGCREPALAGIAESPGLGYGFAGGAAAEPLPGMLPASTSTMASGSRRVLMALLTCARVSALMASG